MALSRIVNYSTLLTDDKLYTDFLQVMKSMSKYADNQPAENDATSGDELDDTAVVQGPRQQIEIDENILLPLRKLKILSQ